MKTVSMLVLCALMLFALCATAQAPSNSDSPAGVVAMSPSQVTVPDQAVMTASPELAVVYSQHVIAMSNGNAPDAATPSLPRSLELWRANYTDDADRSPSAGPGPSCSGGLPIPNCPRLNVDRQNKI